MSFFRRRPLLSKETGIKGVPEYLIVGLGNPGRKYELTRHNAGFLCLEVLSEKLLFDIKKLKFKSLVGDTVINNHRCLIMKPQTYMNNSGEAVREAASFYKIPPENVIVIFDDTSLPLGALRIRRKGSDGGHNGIKSIIYHLNSDNFPRLKLGIGQKPHLDFELKDYVLSGFTQNEAKQMKISMEKACDALELIVEGNIDMAMSKYSS